MKKYKLIKWYSRLPEYWKNKEVIIEGFKAHNGTFYKVISFNSLRTFSHLDIQAFNDCWQEIIEEKENIEIIKVGDEFKILKNNILMNYYSIPTFSMPNIN